MSRTAARTLIDCISVGVDGVQRNFEPMRKLVEACQIALGKLGRGGTDDELRKPLIAVQRVKTRLTKVEVTSVGVRTPDFLGLV